MQQESSSSFTNSDSVIMNNRLLSIIGVGLLSFLSVSLINAEGVPHLYSAQIPIASQVEALRAPAILQAFLTALVKVSGNSKAATNPKIIIEEKNAQNYVNEYSYIQAPAGADQPLLLKVNFNQGAINQLLSENNFAIWQENRPVTLVWMVVNDAKDQHFIHDESQQPIALYFKQAMSARGLPIIFPMLDLSDSLQVQATDVTALNSEAILKASARYSPDAILLVYIEVQQVDQISGHWELLIQGQKMRWETDGSDLASVMQAGVDDVTDALASRYTVVPNSHESSQFTLIVSQLSGVDDYAHLTHYLNHLPGVTNLQVLNVTPEQAKFSVSINSSIETFKQIISLGGRLKAMTDEGQPVFSGEDQTLEYQYLSKGQE